MIELGIIDGVVEYFDQGIAVEPDYETIYHNKGWFLNKLGQHTQALELFKKALALAPNRGVTYENIGNAYEQLGQMDEAISAYTKALTLIDPSFEDIKKQNRLREEDIEKIISTYRGFKEIEKYSHLATFEEIEEAEFNLNIPRYVDTFEEEEDIDIPAVQKEIQEIETELAATQKELNKHLAELKL